jgi:formate dehydrogenase maturation protein FdhE
MNELRVTCVECGSKFKLKYNYTELMMEIGVESETKVIDCLTCDEKIKVMFINNPELEQIDE